MIKCRIVYFSPDPFLADWHVPFGAVYLDTETTGRWKDVWGTVLAKVQPVYEDPKLMAVFKLCSNQFIRQGIEIERAGPHIHLGQEFELPPGVQPYQFLREHMLPGREPNASPAS